MRRVARWWGLRDGLLVALATGIGVAVGFVDSRPSWDDTGVTAAMLLLASALVAGLSSRWPWLWALLVGAWVPILEIRGGSGLGSLSALPIAALGALAGYAVARAGRRA
jgi:hypothetical protein